MDITNSQQKLEKPKTDDDDYVKEAVATTEEDNDSDVCLDLLEVNDTHKSAEHVARSEELLEKEDFDGAAQEANIVLDDLPSLPTIAKAALTRGRALINQLMAQIGEKGEIPSPEVFEKVWNAFELSNRLNPECADTMEEMDKLSAFLREIQDSSDPPSEVAGADFDVIVIGAGCAGVGTALMLTKNFGLDTSRVLLVERGEDVGESFRRWPEEMRFISPSFNQQGWTDSFDLNSISHGSSPAYSLHTEHPSGNEYAAYLSAIATTNRLQVRKLTEVESIRPVGEADGLPLFSVNVRSLKEEDGADAMTETMLGGAEDGTETLLARYIVWAAGEFQYPNAGSTTTKPLEEEKKEEPEEEKKEELEEKKKEGEKKESPSLLGSELCLHNSQVRSWAKIDGDEFLVIGGYESGVDACINLSRAGKRCKVLASTPCWDVKTTDPSAELAPYTAARLRVVTAPSFSPQPQLLAPVRVVSVEKAEGGGFNVTAEWQKREESADAPLRDPAKVCQEPGEEGSTLVLHTPNPPVLATGFEGSVKAAAGHLFDFNVDPKRGCLGDNCLLTEEDESTKIPGVFLVGPQVQHDSLSFCFVYKFRQRFAVVANAICQGLGIDTKAAVADCRQANMYMDNFDSCGDTCGDVC